MPLVLILLLWPVVAMAQISDWVELQDGTRLEGSIVSVSATEIVMDVQATPTIREQRVLPRNEVAEFQRARPDDIAFAALEGLGLPATADDPAVFDDFINSNIRPFMQEFGYSRHMPAARKLLAEAEAERDRLASGEAKVNGEWIPAGEASGPEVGGRVQLSLMKQAADPASGLAAFETLEKQFATSSSFPEAVRHARELLNEFGAEITRTRTDLERREQEREEGLQLARVDQRALIEQGIAQEREAMKARIEATRQGGSKWIPPLPDSNLLTELERAVQTEQTRLERFNVQSMEDAVRGAARAREAIADGRFDDARRELDNARQSWSQYAVLATLNDQLRQAEADAATSANTEPNHPES